MSADMWPSRVQLIYDMSADMCYVCQMCQLPCVDINTCTCNTTVLALLKALIRPMSAILVYFGKWVNWIHTDVFLGPHRRPLRPPIPLKFSQKLDEIII